MSPLPKLAGGRPPPEASAPGANAPKTAPPLIATPAVTADLRRNPRRVSPSCRPSTASAWASRTAPSASIWSRLIVCDMVILLLGRASGGRVPTLDELMPTRPTRFGNVFAGWPPTDQQETDGKNVGAAIR